LIEEKLQRSEGYLAEAQRLTQTGSWARLPGTGTALYWSQEMFRIFGFDPRHGLPSAETFLQRLHPEDRDKQRALWRSSSRKMDYTLDYRILLPDGTMKHIQVTGHPVPDAAGELVEYVGTAADVTERKRAEEALRRSEAYLAEAQRLTHTGSWAWQPGAVRPLYWSDEMFRIYGLDPHQGPPTNETFWERVHPEDRGSMRELLRKVAREKTEYSHEHMIVMSDGTVKHIHGIGHPVLDRAGDVVEFVGTAVDVTERKRAEQERERVRQLEADLAHINRVTTMGELTASLAHEVNQPIAAAITNANACLRWLARNPPDVAEARQAAMRIAKDGTRAAEIIDRLRSFYKKSGAVRYEPVDVNEIAVEMLMLLRSEADRHAITMHTAFAPEIPEVMADRVQLQQVFMNLMLNGIEAMKEAGGELTIRSQVAEDGQLLISVSDTGVGLPAGQADQMFNAFFTTKPQGTGMGLAISRSIIESYGGRLWATGNTGRGATFYFTLPQEDAGQA
jgi:PAS domain S-box-containing protein